MAKFRFYYYDVRGKGVEAQVNDVFETDFVLNLSENPTDSEITDAITENIGGKIIIDHATSNENVIYLLIPVVYTDEETGEVVNDETEYYGELRREK